MTNPSSTTADSKVANNPLLEIGFETDWDLDAEVRESLTTARIGLLLKEPFFGNLATRLTLVNADRWLPTAATDGRRFYYNTKFLKQLTPKQIEFLFGHEVLHVVYDHIGRRGERDGQLSNIAADYCVNGDLIIHKIGEPIDVVPIIHDPKYYGQSFEEVYDDLYENAEKIDIDDLLDRVLDDHLDGDDDSDSGDDGDGSSERPVLSDQERKEIKDEMKEAILSAAQTAGAGNIPAGVARMIKELTEPKMNWRDLIDVQIKSTIKSDFSFMRPNRKAWHTGVMLPGMVPDETIDIVVAIDVSGSISEDMVRDFLSEIKGIMDAYTTFNIKVFCFDTEIYNEADFTVDNLFDIHNYEIVGGGGTSFEAVFEYLKENAIEPKKLIMFTDGYPWGSWGDERYCDTCFIIHTHRIEGAPVPPFGAHAYYETHIS
jgi:predicted metal-dependent peptidase